MSEGAGRQLDVRLRPCRVEVRLRRPRVLALLLRLERPPQPEERPPVARMPPQVLAVGRLGVLRLLRCELCRTLVVAHRVEPVVGLRVGEPVGAPRRPPTGRARPSASRGWRREPRGSSPRGRRRPSPRCCPQSGRQVRLRPASAASRGRRAHLRGCPSPPAPCHGRAARTPSRSCISRQDAARRADRSTCRSAPSRAAGETLPRTARDAITACLLRPACGLELARAGRSPVVRTHERAGDRRR